MTRRRTTALLLFLFALTNAQGAILGLVQLARTRTRVASHLRVDAFDPGEGSGNRGDDSEPERDEDPSPRPRAPMDEDDVKHAALPATVALESFAAGALGWEHDDFAREHLHLDELERPPRA